MKESYKLCHCICSNLPLSLLSSSTIEVNCILLFFQVMEAYFKIRVINACQQIIKSVCKILFEDYQQKFALWNASLGSFGE
jgi:hypothetical protein